LATYLHTLNPEEVKDLIMKEGEEEEDGDSGSHYFRNPNFDLFEETVCTFHYILFFIITHFSYFLCVDMHIYWLYSKSFFPHGTNYPILG